MRTSTYIPSKTAPEPSYVNPAASPKNAAHKDVKYWYKFQNDILLDGVGYTVPLIFVIKARSSMDI